MDSVDNSVYNLCNSGLDNFLPSNPLVQRMGFLLLKSTKTYMDFHFQFIAVISGIWDDYYV